MSCPVLSDRCNQIQLFHFSLCTPLVLISHSPLKFPSCNKTFKWQWRSPNIWNRHTVLFLCLWHFFSFPRVLLSKIDRKENKMTGFHITAVIPETTQGNSYFHTQKAPLLPGDPLSLCSLTPELDTPRIRASIRVSRCVCVWLSNVIVYVPDLLMQCQGIRHPSWLPCCHVEPSIFGLSFLEKHQK